MSNSIWKTDNLQEADTKKQVLFYAGGSSFPYLGWHYPNKGFGTWDYKDVQRWAYLSDVLAQADKAERLQKAVDKALDTLDYVSNEKFATEDGDFFEEYEEMHKTIKQDIDEINQLIKGE